MTDALIPPAPLLPKVIYKPTSACSSRQGAKVDVVVVHRWGSPYVDAAHTIESYHGVISEFLDVSQQRSAHLVFPGSAIPLNAQGRLEITQMVPWDQLAWTQMAYNPFADEIETADALWPDANPKPDAVGLAVLARVVACRLHARGLKPIWSTHGGLCRHGDLGNAGGGHFSCPTTDIPYWKHFVSLVQEEYERSGCSPLYAGR